MMDKLEMAHQYFMQTMGFIRNNDIGHNFDDVVSEAWDYVDAMQAKADKRVVKLPDWMTGDMKNHEHDFIYGRVCACGKVKDVEEEWQPDWSKAPDDCRFFCVASSGGYGFFTNLEPEFMGDYFYVGCKGLMTENHGYTGDWRNSVRTRP